LVGEFGGWWGDGGAQPRRGSREEEDESRGEVPVDAPPGYEEAQRESVQAEMEWRLQDGGRGRED